MTFGNPFAAYLAKKMTKICKKEKLEDKTPKIFGENIQFTKIGYPSDTVYENYGMGNLEKCFNFVQASIIVAIWAYFFFSGIIKLNQMISNRKDFFLSLE